MAAIDKKKAVHGFLTFFKDVLEHVPELAVDALQAYACYSTGNIAGTVEHAAEAAPILVDAAKDATGQEA